MDSEIGTERGNGQDALSLVSTLLADPATVERLVRALSIGGGAEKSEISDGESVESDEKTVEKAAPPAIASAEMADTLGRLSEMISSITAPRTGGGSGGGKHTALLLAIKPYLSQRRGELIDDIIRLSSLGDLLGGLGEGGRA